VVRAYDPAEAKPSKRSYDNGTIGRCSAAIVSMAAYRPPWGHRLLQQLRSAARYRQLNLQLGDAPPGSYQLRLVAAGYTRNLAGVDELRAAPVVDRLVTDLQVTDQFGDCRLAGWRNRGEPGAPCPCHYPAMSENSAQTAFQTASTLDALGREAEAVPHYVKALDEPGLRLDERRSALLGLGSTYRVLGRYAQARETLQQGVEEFPDYAPLKVFLAMTLYNTGESKAAIQTLLRVVLDRTEDDEIGSFATAIALYAEDLDRVW
jgi:tetratricopeptide (TPR) repeat protein